MASNAASLNGALRGATVVVVEVEVVVEVLLVVVDVDVLVEVVLVEVVDRGGAVVGVVAATGADGTAFAAVSSVAFGSQMRATAIAAAAAPIAQTRLAIASILAAGSPRSAAPVAPRVQSGAMSVVTVAEINDFLEREFPSTDNRCEQVGEGWAVARLGAASTAIRPGEIISGTTVFGLCDEALYYACFTVIGIEPMTLTSEMSIRFLRPARGSELRARAELHDVGRRSLVGSIVAWTDDPATPVAVAQGTYVRPRAPSSQPDQ